MNNKSPLTRRDPHVQRQDAIQDTATFSVLEHCNALIMWHVMGRRRLMEKIKESRPREKSFSRFGPGVMDILGRGIGQLNLGADSLLSQLQSTVEVGGIRLIHSKIYI